MRQRLLAGFHRFIDVRNRSDLAVALLSRELGIDIAVDLKGFTQNFRTGIFACRAAPIQVNYLGYPGTMGADYIDYIVADPILVADAEQQHYAEKIVWLPDSYQVNDTRRRIEDCTPSRAETGLPPDGFVFCCFNQSLKITSDVFDGWMRILRRVAGSMLWLLHDNDAAVANLRRGATRRGLPRTGWCSRRGSLCRSIWRGTAWPICFWIPRRIMPTPPPADASMSRRAAGLVARMGRVRRQGCGAAW